LGRIHQQVKPHIDKDKHGACILAELIVIGMRGGQGTHTQIAWFLAKDYSSTRRIVFSMDITATWKTNSMEIVSEVADIWPE